MGVDGTDLTHRCDGLDCPRNVLCDDCDAHADAWMEWGYDGYRSDGWKCAEHAGRLVTALLDPDAWQDGPLVLLTVRHRPTVRHVRG